MTAPDDAPTSPPAPSHHTHRATRRMSAGAYLSHTYRERLMHDVYLDRSCQVAPSYGFDAVPVLAHVRQATVIDHVQHVLLVIVLAWWLMMTPFVMIVAFCVLTTWYALKAIRRLIRDYSRYYTQRGTISDRAHLRRRRRLMLPALFGPWLAAYLASLRWRRADLAHAQAHPAMLALEVAWIIGSLELTVVAIAVVRHLAMAAIRADPTVAAPGGRLGVVAASQYRPVTLYGGYRPFIGAGMEIRTWSFAQRLDLQRDVLSLYPQKPEIRPLPRPRRPEQPVFRTVALAGHVRRQIDRLRNDEDPEMRIPNLAITDHAFVNGFRADGTVGRSDEEIINEVVDNPSEPERHYLACHVVSWHGELVTSMFVHTSIQGNTLYLEFSTWALPPTREPFTVIDDRVSHGARGIIRAVAKVCWRLPGEMARIPHGVGEMISWPLSYLRPGFDRTRLAERNVGAKFSMREFAGDIHTDRHALVDSAPRINYFQFRDIVKYYKLVERRLLSAVADFLEAQGVETTEYAQRALAILNHGVMMVGGESVSKTGNSFGQGVPAKTAAGDL